MNEYHKIQTIYKRDPETKFKTLLVGQFSLPEFEYLAENEWQWTEKLDGTNIRVMWDGENITFGGKTDRAQIPSKLVQDLQETFLSQTDNFKLQFSGTNVCLYGEGIGAGIQKGGGNYCKEQTFVLFDVWIEGWWLKPDDVIDIGTKFGINCAPHIGSGNLFDLVEFVSKGFDSLYGNFAAEGVVARPYHGLLARNRQRIITKLKTKDFQ